MGEPEPLSRDWPTTSSLSAVCRASLRKSPHDRPANATEFAEELRKALREKS